MENKENTFLSSQDFLITGKQFQLVWNVERDMLLTSPQPLASELPKYYESEDYISHTDDENGLYSKLYKLVKRWSIEKKLRLIQEHNNGIGSLLDIGAGTGDFIRKAKDKGWQVSGMEPNARASNLAIKKGISLNSELGDFDGEEFDVITLWHVLEHIPDLEKTIDHLTHLLKPRGVLIIAVPNFKSYDAVYYGKYWAAFDLPRHLWHFSKNSIKRIFSDKFELRAIKPMIFDSFYISLLSEKYRSGKKFALKAFWIGLKSNWKARTSKEYSSHIYCFKKLK